MLNNNNPDTHCFIPIVGSESLYNWQACLIAELEVYLNKYRKQIVSLEKRRDADLVAFKSIIPYTISDDDV